MPGFSDVVEALDRTLGEHKAGNHGAFWRGKTRGEFVGYAVFGFPVVEVGDAANSNIVKALRGQAPFGFDADPPPAGAFMPRMPAFLPPAAEDDIALIEAWIDAGCPEIDYAAALALSQEPCDDETHVRYWREFDHFFHPSLASDETREHVNRWHAASFPIWFAGHLISPPTSAWDDFTAGPQNRTSFEYIRLHQRRIIEAHYGVNASDLRAGHWKFGGDLLPRDPSSDVLPEHRMNGVGDWFIWILYLEMSMTVGDLTDMDIALAQAWQIGVVADGTARTDRTPPDKIAISDFDANSPNLQETVTAHYEAMQPDMLVVAMVDRARQRFS